MESRAKVSFLVACLVHLAACAGEPKDNPYELPGYGETGFEDEGGVDAGDEAGESGHEEGQSEDGGDDGRLDPNGSEGGDGEGGADGEGDEGSAEGAGEDGEEGATDGATEDEGSGACVEFVDSVAPVPPSVLMLLDRSGSMMQTGFDADEPDKSRWQALHEALGDVMIADDMDHFVEFGAKTFSTQGWGECGVSPQIDVPMLLDNSELLLELIPGPLEDVNGGTPTLAALDAGLGMMRNYEAPGAKAVVLITDGSIGCTDDQAATLEQITTELTLAREVDGIATYVVGISPSYNSAKAQLGAMAEAGGGADDYFEAGNAESLHAALEQVVADSYANSCHLDLGESPSDPDQVQVTAGDQDWPEVTDCGSEDGWVWADAAMTRMHLCNAACDALLATQEATVGYFCDPG